ncbi:hypothetical protein AU840_18235 [Salmonella enterica subsp. enterica serovar Virchow]|nr:hypothetical protein [Salmonella enterica subsp. enterica serovar Java]EBV8393106.1 hypothetical protein [Salmonella enterica subsp. enterica serovar Virchow]
MNRNNNEKNNLYLRSPVCTTGAKIFITALLLLFVFFGLHYLPGCQVRSDVINNIRQCSGDNIVC